ncbi:ABC transporter substrate-binding protein [Martelella mediterranea]|uniref:Corrinoid ABC transporter substrate-binding protein n=1 Tax=Martelella mediterranea DSM 17316 TaxID=1122214 RepID=A0A1U9Z103_9HYPH|nr:ABC transporter substrate-binding protein [Martelella mediterranea]AQZ51369.1 corrinoid ABC transporter substrate-binding protein [Martelella mediterranea DSM 17316]
MKVCIATGILSGAFIALAAHAAMADPIEMTDQAGREVRLEGAAERVASIPMPMASTLIAIDGGVEKQVGMNPVAKQAVLEGILGKIYPEAVNIPSDITAPNFIPNVEELAATNPDLVVQWADRGDDLVDPITNAGLTAMLISYGTEEKTREYMTMSAKAMGREDRIGPLIEWREDVASDVAGKASAIADAEKPKVLYLQRAMETLIASGARNNYNTWYIELTGGTSASADLEANGVTINPEQIAEWNPDVILLNNFESDISPERIYDDPILSLTNAAQNHKVYRMPLGGYRWDPPNTESPLTWMWLADLLHPDVFDYDLRAEMKKAYKTIYDYDLTEEDIDNILWIDLNDGAANYDQFKSKS